MVTAIRSSLNTPDTWFFQQAFAPGQGEEASLITDYTKDLYRHYAKPLSRPKTTFMRFKNLARIWQEAIGISSSLQEIALDPAYQEIIGMGVEAVPLILAELQHEPHHWFWALRAITGENPVPLEKRGDIRAMTQIWIKWGIQNGYL